jgi:hypothetical protein
VSGSELTLSLTPEQRDGAHWVEDWTVRVPSASGVSVKLGVGRPGRGAIPVFRGRACGVRGRRRQPAHAVQPRRGFRVHRPHALGSRPGQVHDPGQRGRRRRKATPPVRQSTVHS